MTIKKLQLLSSKKYQIASIFSILMILLGGYLTLHGLFSLAWPQVIPWAGKEVLYTYLAMLIFLTGLVGACSAIIRCSPILVGTLIALFLALLCGELWPCLIVVWFIVAAYLLGDAFLELLKINLPKREFYIQFLIGSGIYGTLVGLFAHFHINYSGLYGFILTIPFLIFAIKTKNTLKVFFNFIQKSKEAEFKFYWAEVFMAVIALIYFIVALMPEKGHDALATHMFIPGHLASRHYWAFDVDKYVWAVGPSLGDWIFSIPYMLSGETAARLLNLSFIFLDAWLVYFLAKLVGASIRGAIWAALIFISTPLTFAEGSTLYVESIWSAYIVAGALLIFGLRRGGAELINGIPISAIFLGCAAATKSITLSILPVIFIVFLMCCRSNLVMLQKKTWGIGACLFLVFGGSPYITAWWITGNPVFPFFNAIFKSTYYPIENFSQPNFGQGVNWDVLYRITFESSSFLQASAGVSGFQWLLLFIPAIIFLFLDAKRKPLALCLMGVLTIYVVFNSTAYLRYVFPAWIFLSAVIGYALGRQTSAENNKVVRLAWTASAALVIALNLLFLSSGAFYRDFKVLTIFDKSERESYLRSNLPIRNAISLVNQLNSEKTPVAIFSHPLAAGLEADALYVNWYNNSFNKAVANAENVEAMARVFLERSADWVILDAGWDGAGVKNEIISKLTESKADIGLISIRRVKREYLFSTEMLQNPDFNSTSGWNLDANIKYDADSKIMVASINALASQLFAVQAGHKYLNTVVARCHKEKAKGRVQINWLNKGNELIGASIKVFDCTPEWREESMEVSPPKDAVVGISYIAGHTVIPIEFSRNSIKQ